jgi:hypothetical protein
MPSDAIDRHAQWRLPTWQPLPEPALTYRERLLARNGSFPEPFPPRRPQGECEHGQTPLWPPFVMIMGVGYSGTSAIAHLLRRLQLTISHECEHPGQMSSGIASWVSTVAVYNRSHAHLLRCKQLGLIKTCPAEPRCRKLHIHLQVRHPLFVVRSGEVTQWSGRYASFHIKNYVPLEFEERWANVSRRCHMLLWWLSFNLLAEAQLDAHSTAWRMEDVFVRHDIRPLQAVLATGHMRSGEAVNASAISEALLTDSAAPVNRHATLHGETHAPKLESWDEHLAQANTILDGTVRRLELLAINAARTLASRYGYTQT